MAKIDEKVDIAIKELKGKEIDLMDLNSEMQRIFKTKKSVFDNIKN